MCVLSLSVSPISFVKTGTFSGWTLLYLQHLEQCLVLSKTVEMALTSVSQLVGHRPAKRKVTVQFPVRAHAWDVGLVPCQGAYHRQPIDQCFSHSNVSLLLFFPPFSSL